MFIQYIKESITKWLSKILDSRSKRMIVLASLFAKLCGDRNKIDIGIAHKLNQVLCLSSKDDALMFPIQISHVIWKDGGDISTLSKDDISGKIHEEAIRLSNFIPSWLRYESLDSMVSDIEKLITYQKQLSH